MGPMSRHWSRRYRPAHNRSALAQAALDVLVGLALMAALLLL